MEPHPSLIAAFIFALCLPGFATAQDEQHFTSAAGRFSITFPGAVEESVDTAGTGDGTIMYVHMVSHAPSDEVVYMVSWVDMTDLLADGTSMKDLLERSRDGSTGSMQATNVKTQALDSTGLHPFIHFTFEASGLVGKERIYFVDKFQYALMTLFPGPGEIPPQADAFIASFKAGGRPRK